MRQIDINYDNVMDIMRTADYLCIDGLVQLCHEFVVECLGPDNCVTVLQFAKYVYLGTKQIKYITTIPLTYLIFKLMVTPTNNI